MENNNFRIDDGLNYCCKSGHDSNNGTINNPRKTPSQNNYLVIGAGDYSFDGAVGTTLANPSATESIVIGDGKVLLRRQSVGTNNLNGGVAPTNIIFYRFNLASIQNGTRTATGCKFYECTGGGGNTSATRKRVFEKCVLLNSTNFPTQGGGSVRIQNSILINNQTGLIDEVFSSYIDTNSVIRVDQINITTFRNNNINGLLFFIGTSFSDSVGRFYAIQDQLTGTPQDNGYPSGVNWLTEAQLTADGYTGTITGWNAAVATCINRDPKFNNAAIEDFTLQADSPHIGRSTDGGNIGGTNVAQSTLVNQDGVGTIEIVTSPEIDTSIPDSYKLLSGEIQGFIRIILRASTLPRPALRIDPIGLLEFNSSITGGSVGNRNVPDSEPLSADYPRKLTTTSLASNTTTLNVTGHDIVAGEFVRVAGEDREVLSVTTDVITVDSAFRAAVASGVTFQVGTEIQLASLRPNRLTYQLRTSTEFNKPETEAEWDNGIDPIYGMAGEYLTQEWNTRPQYVIDVDDSVYGAGDANADPALPKSDHVGTWFDIKVWIRNDYGS
jgi:hypothetical protein